MNISINAVAHNGNGTYYSTIESSLSLAESGTTVYVIPNLGIDVPIKNNVTIKDGVTLSLPYESTTVYSAVNGKNVDYPHADSITSNRTTNVIINDATVTNNGSIEIGGIINGGGGGYESGYSTGKYTQITLNSSTIENNGTIRTYGYIDEIGSNSVINNNSTGTIYAPFVVVEHRGGSSYLGIYMSGMESSPFNRFYMPNIKTKMRTNYKATLYGMADLWANDKHNTTEIGLFGSSSSFLIQMSSGTIIESKFVNSTQIDVYGSINLSYMSITIELGMYIPFVGDSVTLSTKDVLFPISSYYDIDLHRFENGDNSTVNFGSQDVKLLPGASLHIHEGVTLNANTMVVYDSSFKDVIVNAPSAYPSGNAYLTVDGTLNVSNLGGRIDTIYSTGILNVTSSSTVISKEVSSTPTMSATYNSWPFDLSLKMYNGTSVNNTYTKCGTGTYYATNGGWYKVGDISIDYYSNYPSGTLDDYYVSSSTLTSTDENGVIIPSNIDTSIIPTIPDYYEFGGWYFDSSCSSSQKVSNQNIYGDVILYAKWIPIEYNVNVVINHNTGVDSSNTSYNIPSKYKVTDGNIPIGVPTNGDNTFIGWYAKLESGTYSIDVDSLDDLLAYATDKTISIYGYFEGEPTITVDYNYSEILSNPLNALVSENKVIKQADWDTLEYNVTHHDGQLIESNKDLKKYFSHWEDQNGNVFDNNTELSSSITIKAIWYEKATICYFDANGSEITDMRIYVPIENTSEYNSFVLSTLQVNKNDTNEEDANGKFILKYTFDKWKVDTTDLVKDNNDGSYTPKSTNSIIRIIPTFTSKEYVKVSISTSNATVTVKYGNISKTSSFDVERGTTLTISVEYSGNEGQSLTVNDAEFTNGETYIANGNVEINASSSSGCFASGTLITLSNGKTKPIEELTIYDEILVFNHETGSYDSISSSFIINNGFGYYPQVKLMFDDGTYIDVLFGHGFFDMNTNQYEIITTDNVTNYIGHKFYSTNNAQGISLVDYEVSIVYTGCYSLMSPVYINHFANGLLCVSDDIEGFYNVFELDENMKVIQELKQDDINKYGLYTYEEWSEYVTIEQFYALNGQYFKIAIGKGLVTKEKIYYYIENYLSRFQ